MVISILTQYPVQVNFALNIQSLNGSAVDNKPDEKAKRIYNQQKHWKTANVNIAELIALIDSGNAVRPSIKVGGNDKENIKDIYWLFVDFDKPETSIKNTLENPIARDYGAFVYPTPNYTDTHQKHRLVFRLSRSVSVAEYENLYRDFIFDVFPDCDRACFDPGRYFYGTKDKCTIINAENVLDVDAFLDDKDSLEKPQKSVKDFRSAKNETVPVHVETSNPESNKTPLESFLSYLNDHFRTALNSDPNLLYNLFQHDFSKQSITTKEKKQGIVAKYQGANPFSQTNKSGRSFVVSDFQENLPIWYDRSGNAENRNSGDQWRSGGTFLDYWYLLKRDEYASVKTDFKRICNDICEHFGIAYFIFTKVRDAKESLIKGEKNKKGLSEDLKDKIRDNQTTILDRVFVMRTEITIYMYFCWQGDRWGILGEKKVYDESLEKILELFLTLDEIYENRKDLISYVLAFIKSKAKRIDVVPFSDDDYIPFLNGCYSLSKKCLIPHEKALVYNTKCHEFDYEEYPNLDDDPYIKQFKEYWSLWLKSEIKGTAFLHWVILNVHHKATRTGKLLGFVGQPGSGKSTAGTFLTEVCGAFAASGLDSRLFLSVDNQFPLEGLEGMKSLIFEEFKGENHTNQSFDLIKSLSGKKDSKGRLIKTKKQINTKGIKKYFAYLNVAITFDCEREISARHDDGGFLRRIMYFKITKANQNRELYSQYEDMLLEPESHRKILFWCLQQDSKESLEIFESLAEHPEFSRSIDELKKESNPVYKFSEDCLEITNSRDDHIIVGQLYDLYRVWCNANGFRQPLAIVQFGKRMRQTMIEHYYSDEELQERSVKKIAGKTYNVIYGVKISENMAHNSVNEFRL